jgi:hypothetical protein
MDGTLFTSKKGFLGGGKNVLLGAGVIPAPTSRSKKCYAIFR